MSPVLTLGPRVMMPSLVYLVNNWATVTQLRKLALTGIIEAHCLKKIVRVTFTCHSC